MRARILIDRETPRADMGDESLYQDGLSVPDNLADLAACLDSLLRQGEGREAEGLTFSPEARSLIRTALVHLRKAASAGLVSTTGLKCPMCGVQNGYGLICRKCRDEVTR